jgi:hypothetical protein
MIILLTWHYYYLLKPIINTAELEEDCQRSDISIQLNVVDDLEKDEKEKLRCTVVQMCASKWSILSLYGMYINTSMHAIIWGHYTMVHQ